MLIVALGVVAVIVGLLVASGAFSWFGRLPGDIRLKGDNYRVYIPITSMLLLSIGLSLLLTLIRRLF